MSRDIEERIAAAAACQYGIVTRAQLMAAGLSRWAVDRRARSGRLRRLHLGVYAVGLLMPPRAREMAAALACGPGAVVSHGSAAVLWTPLPEPTANGQPWLEPKAERVVEITIERANRGRRPGIRVHRVVRLDPEDRTVLDGIPVTTPARTLLDIASVLGSRELERAVARAEREGLVDDAALRALLERSPRRPGTPLLRAVLDRSGGPAFVRSEAEAAFLALVDAAGLPRPRANVRIDRYEIDFLWPAESIAVEIDGFRHHSSRPRFESDCRRDTRLGARGIHVIRLTWRQITQDAVATAVQIGQALARAARPADAPTTLSR